MRNVTLTLLSRPGCHLCDDAREAIVSVVADFPTVTVVEKSIDDDEALRLRYAEEIPVVLINDKVHNIWRVHEARLRAALEAACG